MQHLGLGFFALGSYISWSYTNTAGVFFVFNGKILHPLYVEKLWGIAYTSRLCAHACSAIFSLGYQQCNKLFFSVNGIPITGKYNLLSFLSFFMFDDNLIQEPSIACVEMTKVYHVKKCNFFFNKFKRKRPRLSFSSRNTGHIKTELS